MEFLLQEFELQAFDAFFAGFLAEAFFAAFYVKTYFVVFFDDFGQLIDVNKNAFL